MPEPRLSEADQRCDFHYIKSGLHRSIHVDGVHGGPSPRGKIVMSFFNERQPIPTLQSYKIDGTELGEEDFDLREQRTGYLREIETTLYLDLDTAKQLQSWLERMIKVATDVQEANKE